ncbi:protein-L-isoaspartate(D-aspartate) O-methyltransferase [Grimontia hollisae]|uniref:Protein-L-isoaspartate O-methyltransferase n=2 Tax=Grimontia hollisae TaxID=673 RepID=D0I4J3_GRIHO|nr:protein-L-isoaspartate(D-aspartate) O-methyltransferase [Grimontia hollisae]EEY73410.1 protein-L-isoaspartate O-methyltransferase [Grimontia hollisae CIP 101886]STO42664.1 Protein-L-isoaspartate O-methyltransferase [Grimontia hollisae]STO56520.1 Protein-L-isoaspartate O-methyltransferase [Grimontia hollisae]STQ77428.1 Protein-L-isoaspartate O-methyltransferase [Grimontia hollisae]
MNYSHSLIQQLRQQGISDQRVLDAIARLPRHLFVSEAMAHQAYDNNALPIGFGQTISQPYIVAKMTELLNLRHDSRVLEIGTGSGFQTCVLAQLVEHVYSVERIKQLQMVAKRRFKQFELYNISTKHGDGWQGWASKGPFDAIIVTAAASSMPQALIEQLADGGSLIVPVGEIEQTLYRVTRCGDDIETTAIEAVRFVPLVAGDLA